MHEKPTHGPAFGPDSKINEVLTDLFFFYRRVTVLGKVLAGILLVLGLLRP